uniref:Centrosomal protein of 135 kDa n=1 Tax=Cacopsylla melanoneura TaxID=428564 RepID=A0A8D8QSB1_9HEMI
MGYETESIYKSLRSTLDELGYHQALSFDSLYLVKALVADLIQTTQSLKHYKELSQKTLSKCNELEVGLQPYKEDNARLVQECNRLHKKLIAQKDNHEDAQKELKFKLRQSESEKESLEFNTGELTARLADVEKECLKKNQRIHELQNVILKRHPHRNLTSSKSTWGGKGDSAVTFESKLKASTSLDSTVHLLKQADSNTKALRGEVKELQQRLDNKEYVIDNLQTKLNTRNTEITRLTSLLEGGRPVAAVIQDHTGDTVTHPTCIQSQMFCTCNDKPAAAQAQGCRFTCLEQRNSQLEKKLKECLRRQHDAMQHALRLSDKNKMLEVRLKSVEQSKDSEKASKDMTELQNKISSLTKLIEDLRKENQNQQNQGRYTKTKTSLTTSKSERESVQLREKVEDYKILEKDLMSEIDRLERENTLQKTYITELEYKLLQCLNSKEDLERAVKVKDALRRDAKEQGGGGGTVTSTTCDTEHRFEGLIKERDHYQKEYAFIVDKLTAIPLRTHTVSRELPLNNLSNLILERDEYQRQSESLQHVSDNRSDTVHCELKRRLSDQGQEISHLKHKYKLLEQEYADTSSLKTKYKFLEEEYRREKAGFTSSRQEPFTRDEETDMSARRRGGSPNIGTGVDLDTYLNLQEERDRLYASNVKLQEEKAELLSRLKRVQIDACSMNEDRIRSLESERCHLISKQTELNSRLGELEEENRGLKRKLYVHENELSEERNSLNSIRRVQEQTDQALLSFRKTHDNLESQIRELKDQNCRLDAEKDSLVTQVESLREDNARMRSCMMSLDGQKDSILMTLDSKIDLISRLERDMCSKDSKIEQLEDRIAKFKTTVE